MRRRTAAWRWRRSNPALLWLSLERGLALSSERTGGRGEPGGLAQGAHGRTPRAVRMTLQQLAKQVSPVVAQGTASYCLPDPTRLSDPNTLPTSPPEQVRGGLKHHPCQPQLRDSQRFFVGLLAAAAVPRAQQSSSGSSSASSWAHPFPVPASARPPPPPSAREWWSTIVAASLAGI